MREHGIADADHLLEVPWEQMSTGDLTAELVEKVHELVGAFFRSLSKQDIAREARVRRIMAYPVDGPADVLTNEQLRAREAFRPLDVAGRRLDIVGVPLRSTAYTPDVTMNGPIVDVDPTDRSLWRTATVGRPESSSPVSELPLAGVRVLDFGWAVVSPLTTKYLALFGADVIKLEYRRRPDPTRMTGPYPLGRPSLDGSAAFVSVNASKR